MSIISVFAFAGFVSIIGLLLLWLLIAYPKRYKKNVNRALQSGVPVKTIEPTILFGGIALVTLIILNIMLIVSVNNLQREVTDIRNDVSNLSQQQQYLSWDVNDIETTILRMYEDTKWVDHAEYEIIDLTDQGEAVVDVTIRFNRVSVNGTITLVSESDSGVEETVIVSTTTTFTTQVTLDIDSDYDFYVMVEDGSVVESEDIFDIDVTRILYDSKRIEYHDETNGSNGDIIGYLTIRNNYSLHPDLAFDSVEMIVALNDQIVDTSTITTPDHTEGTLEYFEFTVNWNDYGNGLVMVTFIGTDGFGNEYELFGEGFEVEMD